jgi:predicted XRE-type DNA-binding protein
MMDVKSFDNVWDALCDTSGEAANMTARSDLLAALQRTVAGWGLTQTEAARRLGITRPRLSDLMCGKISKFSLDALVNLSAQAGLSVEIRVTEAA